jgi:hypothetical protein
MTPAVDMRKVSEFVPLVDPSAQLALARKSSGSPSNAGLPPRKPTPVEVSVVVKPPKQFPPVIQKRKIQKPVTIKEVIDVPGKIIAHLTRECGGNVHDRSVVEIRSGSFEMETDGANPHSGAFCNSPGYAAKNAADLEADSCFHSAYRTNSEIVRHTRNNWVCYDFKERRIVTTHYAIRTNWRIPGG